MASIRFVKASSLKLEPQPFPFTGRAALLPDALPGPSPSSPRPPAARLPLSRVARRRPRLAGRVHYTLVLR